MAKMKGPDRVKAVLEALSLDCEVLTLPASTRTAEEAAAAVGCMVGEIAKSLVFRAGSGAVVAVLSGDDRLDPRKLSEVVGAEVERADAKFVRAATGFAIGGVPPLGHAGPVTLLMDTNLFRFARVWAAAGSPFSVFAIAPARLRDAAGATVAVLRAPIQKRMAPSAPYPQGD
ncbi:MAG: YbaK/EbsC family protein [Alphaproteobacteria bacterium]|nr:YbaK/EbsC family protein [Alphaproteobacteria bacterium]MCY4229549.1 YbaK/EbsC family protein [Alphaproteobacteria bacterium]